MNQQKYYCKECGREISEYTNSSNRGMCYTCSQNAYIADTFISAGIGDVSEWKHKAERAEKELADLKTEMLHKYNFGVKVPMEVERLQLKIKIEQQAEKELQEEGKNE